MSTCLFRTYCTWFKSFFTVELDHPEPEPDRTQRDNGLLGLKRNKRSQRTKSLEQEPSPSSVEIHNDNGETTSAMDDSDCNTNSQKLWPASGYFCAARWQDPTVARLSGSRSDILVDALFLLYGFALLSGSSLCCCCFFRWSTQGCFLATTETTTTRIIVSCSKSMAGRKPTGRATRSGTIGSFDGTSSRFLSLARFGETVLPTRDVGRDAIGARCDGSTLGGKETVAAKATVGQ